MKVKVSVAQLVIIISLVFVGVGLITPLPYIIFSTLGVFGVIIGWLMDISQRHHQDSEEESESNSDVNINVTETHPVNFDERLRKLEQLKIDDIISDSEYNRKRKQIMDEEW